MFLIGKWVILEVNKSFITLIERCSHSDMLSLLKLRGRMLYSLSLRPAQYTWTYVSRSNFLFARLMHPQLDVDGVQLHLHLAADTLNSVSVLVNDIMSAFKPRDK